MSAARNIAELVRALGSGGNRAAVAARALAGLIEDENPVNCAAIADAGGIPALVECLRSNSTKATWQDAAWVLLGLSKDSSERCAVIASEGAIPVLVQRFHECSDVLQCLAAVILGSLAVSSPGTCAAIAAQGAIPLLVGGLGSRSSEMVHAPAANALASLAHQNPATSSAIVAAGGVPALVQCLQHSDEPLQIEAALALTNLSACGPDICEAVASVRGIIPLLVQRLRNGDMELQEVVVALLSNLSRLSQGAAAAMASEGVIPVLVQCLVNGSEALQLRAAAVLYALPTSFYALAGGSSGHSAAIVAAGGIPAFQQYLRSGGISQAERQRATVMLGRLSILGQAGLAPAGEGNMGPASAQDATMAAGAEPAVASDEAGPANLSIPRVCAAEGCNNTEHLRLCSGCKTLMYCSDGCQHAHWRAHKRECRRLRAAAEDGQL